LIAGPSGCGKSTLLRCLNGLVPTTYKGALQGSVRVGGRDTRELTLAEISRTVGTVLQDPERQIVASYVFEEVAFGLENLALPPAEIRARAEATLRDLRSAPETARLAEERGWDYYLEEIVRQALRCKHITRGLLDLARRQRARREPVDLNHIVEHTARVFGERGREAGASVSVTLDPEVGEVATDEVMVRQVLDNLLSNALDAVGQGGAVEVTTALDGGRVCVEVRDDGPGIPPDVLPRVFDPFFTTKEPGRGTGLGLAISLTFAESIGGALTAESKPGAGTRFRLWLPRRAPARD
jgi:signal transduction histidine kinase